MSSNLLSTCEYEVQYFGFHPSAFTDEMHNNWSTFIEEALIALQDHLVEEHENEIFKKWMLDGVKFGDVTTRKAIEEATEQIFQEYLSKLDQGLDKLEVYLGRNVLCIPKEVVLPEDKIHIEKPVTESEDDQLDSELEDLKQKILEAKKQRAYLSLKKREQRSILRVLQFQRKNLEEVENIQEKLVFEENLSSSLTKASELLDLLPDP